MIYYPKKILMNILMKIWPWIIKMTEIFLVFLSKIMIALN